MRQPLVLHQSGGVGGRTGTPGAGTAEDGVAAMAVVQLHDVRVCLHDVCVQRCGLFMFEAHGQHGCRRGFDVTGWHEPRHQIMAVAAAAGCCYC